MLFVIRSVCPSKLNSDTNLSMGRFSIKRRHRVEKTPTWPRGRVGRPPFSIGCIWQGVEAVFRGLVLTFYCVGFGLLAFASVSHHRFLVSPLVLGLLLCGVFVFVFN